MPRIDPIRMQKVSTARSSVISAGRPVTCDFRGDTNHGRACGDLPEALAGAVRATDHVNGMFGKALSGTAQRPRFPRPSTPIQRISGRAEHTVPGLPLCLGHEDQLDTSGTVLAREVAGLPLLMTRDSSGAVHVFLNACRHRGARLVTGEETVCRRSSLSCLYHGWTYGLDGRLLSVPRRDAFPTLDVAAHGLRQLPSAVRHGLIWATLDPEQHRSTRHRGTSRRPR